MAEAGYFGSTLHAPRHGASVGCQLAGDLPAAERTATFGGSDEFVWRPDKRASQALPRHQMSAAGSDELIWRPDKRARQSLPQHQMSAAGTTRLEMCTEVPAGAFLRSKVLRDTAAACAAGHVCLPCRHETWLMWLRGDAASSGDDPEDAMAVLQLAHFLASDITEQAKAFCDAFLEAPAEQPSLMARASTDQRPSDTRNARAWRLLQAAPPDVTEAVLRAHDVPLAHKLQAYPASMHVLACRSCSELRDGHSGLALDATRPAVVAALTAALPQLGVAMQWVRLRGRCVPAPSAQAIAHEDGLDKLCTALSQLPGLISVDLSSKEQPELWRPVQALRLTAVTSLSVSQDDLCDLEPLCTLTTLRDLTVVECAEDVSVRRFIAALTQLERLELRGLSATAMALVVTGLAKRAGTLRNMTLQFGDWDSSSLPALPSEAERKLQAYSAAHLAALPGLTRLRLHQYAAGMLQALGARVAGFSALLDLGITATDTWSRAQSGALCDALAALPRLTSLELKLERPWRSQLQSLMGHASPLGQIAVLLTARHTVLERLVIAGTWQLATIAAAAEALAALPSLTALQLGSLDTNDAVCLSDRQQRPWLAEFGPTPPPLPNAGGRVLSLGLPSLQHCEQLMPALRAWGGAVQLSESVSMCRVGAGAREEAGLAQLVAASPRLQHIAAMCTCEGEVAHALSTASHLSSAHLHTPPDSAHQAVATFGRLTSLTQLVCDFSCGQRKPNLTSAPASLPVGHLTTLRHLDLRNNQMVSPEASAALGAQVVRLRQLTALRLHQAYPPAQRVACQAAQRLRQQLSEAQRAGGACVAALAAGGGLPATLRELELRGMEVCKDAAPAIAAMLARLTRLTRLELGMDGSVTSDGQRLVCRAILSMRRLVTLTLGAWTLLRGDDTIMDALAPAQSLLSLQSVSLRVQYTFRAAIWGRGHPRHACPFYALYDESLVRRSLEDRQDEVCKGSLERRLGCMLCGVQCTVEGYPERDLYKCECVREAAPEWIDDSDDP